MKKTIGLITILVILALALIYLFVIRQSVQRPKVVCNYQYQEAQYFLASTTNFLLIDQGTAPDPRVIIVYDLNKCAKVYEGQYSKPFALAGETATYWDPINDEVSDENCPKNKDYLKEGLGVGLESHIALNLSNLTKKSLGEVRCSPRQ